ncbi:hypothetical protein DRO69_08855 [Candidatus Bathyarchaeota archaeon]|nr:MAG: hypothetical protein DRO69_08855 [Candidatus Bathyarchaeota archaeon]
MLDREAVCETFLTLLLTGMLTLAFNVQPATSELKTWTVNDDGSVNFHMIQETMKAASPRDTIYIHADLRHDPHNSDNPEPEFVPGQIILKFKLNVSIGQINGTVTTGIRSVDELNKRFEVTEMQRVLGDIFKLVLPEDGDVVSISREYGVDSNVEYAEPNYIYRACVLPNDADYTLQWAHQAIQSELAWDIETGDPDVVIAVVDTGVDWDHPDLAANIWNNTDEKLDGKDTDGNGYIDDVRGYDFVDTTASVYPGEDGRMRDNDPMDFHGHGTHVAGIAAAVTNNSIGVAGVSWNCKVMPVRAGYKDAYGYGVLEADDVAVAIEYAVNNNANVICMSWGSYSISNTVKEAIDYAYAKGAILISAAGNGGTYLKSYPAGYDNVIAVAATGISNVRAGFSNYGSWIDIAAPGVDVLSTVFNDAYASWSGTSMSTSFVAGLAALILSKNSTFSNEEVRNILRSTIDPVISDEYIGLGRINAYKAVVRNSTLHSNLDSSLDNAIVQDVISINGTASGSNFHKYEVYYGLGAYPTDWTQIGFTQYTQVIDGVLATWDTSLAIDGIYSIRLDVVDINGQVTEDRVVLRIDNSLQDGWPIYLDTHAILASPVVYDFDKDGKNELVVATYGPPGDPYGGGRVYIIRSNGAIVRGWPFITPSAISGTPAIGDLNNDGTPELVVSDWHHVYVLHFDGSVAAGWPKHFGFWVGQTPTLSDLDGDSFLEIILSTDRGRIYAWNYDGSSVDGWPVTLSGADKTSGVAVGDTDNDGYIEIVVNTENNKTYILNHDGSVADGWPQYIPSVSWWASVNRPPALADLNGDGYLEIIRDAGDKLHVLQHDGTLLSGWPKNIESYGNNAFSLGDLDSDGLPEIVFGRHSYDFAYLYALNGDGSDVVGWPISLPYPIQTPCVIADINSDSTQEVIVRGDKDKIYIFNSDGSSVEGWPKTIKDFHHSGTYSPSPLVTDLDGDGDIEIVALSFFNSIYVWDLPGAHDPSKIEWPMFQHDERHTGLYVQPLPPVANFTWSPSIPKVGESVTFDASSSTPNGGEIVSYEWDFGDRHHVSGKIVSHKYTSSGTFTVTLNVTDSEGLWDVEQKQIQVVQPHGPKAEFTAIPETANVGELVKFDASASLPGWNGTHEIPITEYRWDFGDGNKTTTSNPIAYHSFSSSGNYYVTLTVYAPGATPEIDSVSRKVTIISVPVGGYSVSLSKPAAKTLLICYTIILAMFAATISLTRRKKITTLHSLSLLFLTTCYASMSKCSLICSKFFLWTFSVIRLSFLAVSIKPRTFPKALFDKLC